MCLRRPGLGSRTPVPRWPGHSGGRTLGLKAEFRCSARKDLVSYGLKEVELQQEGHRLDAAGALYVPLTDNKRPNPITPLPLSVDTPVYKRNLPVEKRFEDSLKRERSEMTKVERMEEALSDS